MKDTLLKLAENGTLPHLITALALCWLVTQAARVTGHVSAHADKLGNDGWKKLLAVRKSSADFFLTVAVVIAILLRYVDRMSQDLFITIFIAYLAFLGIRISADGITFKTLAEKKSEEENKQAGDGT